ncbi:MAG: PBSX family phage terminase large subunit, partial [Firmicutes bacterium HGW-Firmicutes-18]
MVDNVESVLYNKALEGDTTSVIFFLKTQGKGRGYVERQEVAPAPQTESINSQPFTIPADVLAATFINSHRAVMSGKYDEFLEYGGRGSTKSTFVGYEIINLIKNNPTMHALAMRQVADTLRNSVYGQIKWCIEWLGLTQEFKFNLSPMEITYLPTGQKIYFAGADNPTNIKSIKPPFGYIGILWLEETDQFHGAEAVRTIEQSIRGGEKIYKFKTWNTPRTANNWINKYLKIPKEKQWRHLSTYLDVPVEWLGQPWIDEAEHLKSVNPKAYDHEYTGLANSSGGMVFENVTQRKITDAEIKTFNQLLRGNDWGWFPDPFSFGLMYYNPATMKLYIFGELRANKTSNRKIYDKLIELGLIAPKDLLIADNAEPKSIADFRAYGCNIIGAEKGPDSVDYSMKWLQSLAEIIIDPDRCPYHAEEFSNYELEKDKEGEYGFI